MEVKRCPKCGGDLEHLSSDAWFGYAMLKCEPCKTRFPAIDTDFPMDERSMERHVIGRQIEAQLFAEP